MEFLKAADYIVLLMFLMCSSFIGLYQAFRGKRQTTADEYLLADRRMNPLVVIMSAIVSVTSPITYMGNPAEVYLHGPQYLAVLPSKIIPILFITISFVPIYYKLRVTSIYEYLRIRFGENVQYFGAAINCIFLILIMAINVYAPAMALNAITGLSIPGSIIAVGLVCTLYTSLGGIKAVLWTGVFQAVISISGILVTIIACSVNVGGITEVFRINARDGRDTYLDFRPSPAIRHTFWSVFIGLGVMAVAYNGTNQMIVQRYMTCKSLRQAKLVAGMTVVVGGLVQVLTGVTGLFLYAYFAGCDPVTSGVIEAADQLMAYIIINLFHEIPGLTGFLMSAIFSATLGVVSSGINSLATMIGQDIIKNVNPNINDLKYTLVVKVVATLVGGIIISLAFVVSVLGNVLEASITIAGILNGPLLGVFMLGIYFPWSNSKGALAGMVSSVIIGIWLKTGSFFYPPVLDDPPLFVDQCPELLTHLNQSSRGTIYYEFATKSNAVNTNAIDLTDDPSLYSLSYAYYTLLTTVVTVIFGLFVSFVTCPTDPSRLDPALISPITHRICHTRGSEIKTNIDVGVVGISYRRANVDDIEL
ncbi:Sodium-coupled monocarboxylate transporter 2 [Holothuria leucospilota]|uniref:Sodium-coupled monocarboxylate transporter 2 n=1 Tax=Holothuria leucospilota TaxID=206669 RepID=A0A9Q1BPI9_HOLLE|nr:Sodium-coupled monocarboxylate transporter 2 [Holothuria leucospilota]